MTYEPPTIGQTPNSKNGMATKGVTYLATNTLPVILIQSVFALIPLGRYLLPYHSAYWIDIYPGMVMKCGTVAVVRYGVSLVTVLLLDFVSIHWIQLFLLIQWRIP